MTDRKHIGSISLLAALLAGASTSALAASESGVQLLLRGTEQRTASTSVLATIAASSDTFRTKAGEQLEIAFARGTSIILAPHSELKLTRFEDDDRTVEVEIRSGTFQVTAAAGASVKARMSDCSVSIENGISTMVASGAKLYVFLNGRGQTELSAAGESTLLYRPGFGTGANCDGGKPEDASRVDPKLAKQAREALAAQGLSAAVTTSAIVVSEGDFLNVVLGDRETVEEAGPASDDAPDVKRELRRAVNTTLVSRRVAVAPTVSPIPDTNAEKFEVVPETIASVVGSLRTFDPGVDPNTLTEFERRASNTQTSEGNYNKLEDFFNESGEFTPPEDGDEIYWILIDDSFYQLSTLNPTLVGDELLFTLNNEEYSVNIDGVTQLGPNPELSGTVSPGSGRVNGFALVGSGGGALGAQPLDNGAIIVVPDADGISITVSFEEVAQGDGDVSIDFSTLANADDPSAFLAENEKFAIVTGSLLDDPAFSSIDSYSYLEWGVIFSKDQAETDPFSLPAASWVAGDKIAPQDFADFAGEAEYKGHAIGNVVDDGSFRTVVGTYSNTWDFGAGQGTVAMSFDGSAYTGNTSLGSQGFTGTIGSGARSGRLEGDFFRGGSDATRPAGVGGTFEINGPLNDSYTAAGTFAAERTDLPAE